MEFMKAFFVPALKNPLVRLLIVFAFFVFVFSLVYFTTDRVSSLDDQFFHIRFAEIFRERPKISLIWSITTFCFIRR